MLAEELQEQKAVAIDMRLVNAVCTENHELNTVFRNPEVKMSKKVSIVDALFGEHVGKTSLAFLEFVVKKHRSVNLRGISAAYLDLFRESQGIVLSKFTTAEPVDQEVLDMVSQAIAAHTHKEVEMVAKTDPKIIGGFAMEFDNTIYDARLSTRLTKLRQQFEKNIYESKL
jgi:F-type H+-transporting ATPase subunit delta